MSGCWLPHVFCATCFGVLDLAPKTRAESKIPQVSTERVSSEIALVFSSMFGPYLEWQTYKDHDC